MNSTWRTTAAGIVAMIVLGALQWAGKLDAGTLSAILGVFGTITAKHVAGK